MRAVLIGENRVAVVDAPDPEPTPHDVVVQVTAAGLNAADVMQIRGGYPAPEGWPPLTPGMEFAGRVERLGARVYGWEIGDRVMALVGGGAHAERIAVPADLLIRIPDSVDDLAAAGFLEAYSTAWDALISQGRLRAGERVLITGAAGGVGTAAIQIASLAGADVVASARGESSHARLRALAPRVTAIVPETENDNGRYDVVLELVGGADSMQRVRTLQLRGRIVVIGVGAGAQAMLPLGALMQVRGSISASTLRARPHSEKVLLAREIEHHLVGALASGSLSVPIDSRFGLEQAADAYERQAASGKFGKVVLTM
jgi:NADPH2:quinone reductase